MPVNTQRVYSATTPTWTSQPVPEPPLLPPLVDLANWIATLPPIQEWPTLLIDRLLLAPVTQLLQITRDILLSPKTHRVVVRLGVLATIFWIALAAAVVSYIGFYRAWVPDVGLRKEIWLQYGHDRPPFAHLDFGTAAYRHQLGEPSPSSSSYNPSTDISGEYFAQDQAYDVTLEISVPLNQANLDLGNFMVDLDLKSRSNRSVFHVSKPTLLTYSTAPVRAADSISQMMSRNPPAQQAPATSQLLRIPLLRRAVLRPSSFAPPLSSTPPDPRADRKVTHGQVSVGRSDQNKFWMYGGNHNTLAGVQTLPHNGRVVPLAVGSHSSRGELQTYAASLRFDAHLSGLRFFMYHFPLLSFIIFTGLFLALEMATALTLWSVAAIYTSTMTVAPVSLDTDEHFQNQKSWRPSRRSDEDYGVKTETETTPSAEDSAWQERRYEQRDDEEDETETETEARRRYKREPRIKTEGYDDEDQEGSGVSEEEEMRLRSLQSLQAKDEADLAEAIRQSRMRDLLEARRMGGAGPSGSSDRGMMQGESLIDIVDPTSPISPEELSEIQMSRRVLDRLDEETEEDTDVASSRPSRPSSRLAARTSATAQGGGNGSGETESWEDLDDESASGESADAALRQRRKPDDDDDDDDDGGDGTIGGSETSGRRTARSFGATTTAGASSSTRTG
uniref:Seipin n=1 Tax=Kalmanozyma brasiliensis (strain GHG001) TaxID=1365824 RepID=V5EXS1_KALBG